MCSGQEWGKYIFKNGYNVPCMLFCLKCPNKTCFKYLDTRPQGWQRSYVADKEWVWYLAGAGIQRTTQGYSHHQHLPRVCGADSLTTRSGSFWQHDSLGIAAPSAPVPVEKKKVDFMLIWLFADVLLSNLPYPPIPTTAPNFTALKACWWARNNSLYL